MLKREDKSKITLLLTPAIAQCQALAWQFNLNPESFGVAHTPRFDIMLNKIVYDKQVTPEQLAEALQAEYVGEGQLVPKILSFNFELCNEQ